jgi:hypothetical protein
VRRYRQVVKSSPLELTVDDDVAVSSGVAFGEVSRS